MATSVDVLVKLLGDSSGFKKSVASAQADAATLTQKLQAVGGVMQSVGKKMTVGLTLPIVAGMGLAVKSASDLGESVNAVEVTFGKASKGILDLGKNAATAVGMSATEFNGLAVQFSNFAKTVAGPGGNVVKTMEDLTTRAADFASVMNIDVADASRIFQSGLAGESEPLRKYGINVSAAAVETYAWANGIAESGKELTEAQKVQARYGLIMKQTAKDSGDFANTSDSLANKSRILKAQISNVAAQLGESLVPAVEKVVGWIGKLATWFSNLSPGWKDFAVKAALVVAAIGPMLIVFGKILTLIPLISKAFTLLNAAFITSPIGWIVLGIVALVAAFVLLWKKCAWFRNFWIAVWEHVKGAFAAVWPVIKAVGEAIVGALQWAWDTISGALHAFWDWAGPWITEKVTLWWEASKQAAAMILEALSTVWDWVSAALHAFWDWAGPFITAAVRQWWEQIKMTMTAIKAVFTVVWPIIVSIVRGAIENIKRIVATIRTIIAVIQAVWNAVKKGATAAWNVATGIVGVVSNGMRKIRDLPGEWLDRIKDAVGKVWTSVKNAATKAWDSITGVVSGAFTRIKGYANDVISAINYVISKLNSLAHTNIGTIPLFGGGRSAAQSNGGTGGAANTTSAFGSSAGMAGVPHDAAGSGKGGGILGGIGDLLGGAADWVVDLWDKFNIGGHLPKPVGGLFGNATDALYGIAKDAIVSLLKKHGGGPGQRIVDWAKTQLGKPYLWGATGPNAYDCSGLIYRAYLTNGASIPRTFMWNAGRRVSAADARPADVGFFSPNNSQGVKYGHVKMYAGNNQTIESGSGGVHMSSGILPGASEIRTYLAKGGVIIGGESGEEAVLPLTDPKAMQKVRDGIGAGTYNDNRTINLYVKPNASGRIDVKQLWRDLNALEGKATAAARHGRVRG